MRFLKNWLVLSIFFAFTANLLYSASDQRITLSSSPETALKTLVSSGQKLLQDWKNKKIAFKAAQIRAYQDYNTLEKVINAYKATSKREIDQNLLDLGDYILLQLSTIFKLQTPVAQKAEQLSGAINYLSTLWSKAKNIAPQTLDSLVNGLIAQKSWARDQFGFIVDKLTPLISVQAVLEIIYKGFGISREELREAAKQALMKKYNLHEVSPEWRTLIDEALENTGLSKDIVFLQGENLGEDIAGFHEMPYPFLSNVIALRPINAFLAKESALFTLYHELGHAFHQHSAKYALYSQLEQQHFKLVLALLAFTIADTFYQITRQPNRQADAVITAKSKIILGLALLPFIPPLFAGSYKVALEKQADLFACDQLMKNNQAQVVLSKIVNPRPSSTTHPSGDEYQEYMLQCLINHKDKIPEYVFKQDEILSNLISSNKLEELKKLLDAGFSFSCDWSLSPLDIAIIYQRLGAVEEFLKHDVTLETCPDHNPLVLFVLSHNKSTTRALAKKYKNFGNSPLVQKALRLTSKERAELLDNSSITH